MGAPLFGYAGEEHVRKDRQTIKRDSGGHERWADAILPADAAAGVLETPTSRRPLIVLAMFIGVSATLLGAQLFHLEISNGGRNLGLADGNRLRQTITRAPRGVIYDRHHNVLAQNLASFDVTVAPSLLPAKPDQRQVLYARVGALLGISPAQVSAKAEGDCIKAEITAKISPARAQSDCLGTIQPRLIATNVAREVALNFDQSSTQVPGFALDTNPIRQYNTSSLSAILGYTGRVSEDELKGGREYTPTDFIGKLGIEASYEMVLRGRNGSTQTEVDASGKPIKLLASKPAKSGQNLVLTIDGDLQNFLAGAIQRQMDAASAKQGTGVAIDPRSGEILAVVNLPTYDNNLFAKGIDQKAYAKLINDKAQPLFNKAIAGAYPTGSIIKPLVGAAALESKVVTPNTSIDDTGSIVVHNQYDSSITYTYRSYTDYETGYSGKLGVVNMAKALAVSSDVFFYTIGGGFGNIGGLGVDRLTGFYHKFGLGQKPEVDLNEQTAGRVPTPDSKKKATGQAWTTGDTYNISIGQGDLVASPLQMAVAEAAIANGGKVLAPHFLKEVQGLSGSTTKTVQPRVITENFIAPDHLKTIKQGMHDVVYASYGTACCKLGQEVPAQVGAKTGTAQTDDTTTSKPNAWFTAFAPFDNPQIEIVVLIQNSGEGAKFAAPAVRETLAWCFTRPGGCVQ